MVKLVAYPFLMFHIVSTYFGFRTHVFQFLKDILKKFYMVEILNKITKNRSSIGLNLYKKSRKCGLIDLNAVENIAIHNITTIVEM